MQFRLLNWVMAGTLVALAAAACRSEKASEPPPPAPRQQATLRQGPRNGAAIFAQECSPCHGLDGKALTSEGKVFGAADLTDSAWKHGSDRATVIDIITNGVNGAAMPAFEKKLDTQQIEAVADYVRGLAK